MSTHNQNDDQRFTMKSEAEPPHAAMQQRKRSSPIKFVFLIILDATASMTPYIQGVLNALYRVLDVLAEGEFEPQIGMVVFRDELEGEMPVIFPVGTSPEELRAILSTLEAVGGGTIPESSLPAIMQGIALLVKAETDVPRVFLHISDAPPHDPEAGHTAKSVRDALLQNGVIYSACVPDIEPYRTFANASGGTLFPIKKNMDAETFQAVLVDFAKTTIKTLRRELGGISDEVREKAHQILSEE